jgi:hypothetical protein
MATSDTVRRFVGTADGWHAWVFRGFVVFAVVMGGRTAIQHARLDRALGRAAMCLAQADAACAGRAVEDASAIDADHPRVRLASAGLHLLLGEVDEAKGGLANFTAGEMSKNLTTAARGDILLLQGDIEVAAGALSPAKDHYAAARVDGAPHRHRHGSRDGGDRRAASPTRLAGLTLSDEGPRRPSPVASSRAAWCRSWAAGRTAAHTPG